MGKNKNIEIDGNHISIISADRNDYISLRDMARSQLQEVVIIKWLSLKSTHEYLGEREALIPIQKQVSPSERLPELNKVAITQMKSLLKKPISKQLK